HSCTRCCNNHCDRHVGRRLRGYCRHRRSSRVLADSDRWCVLQTQRPATARTPEQRRADWRTWRIIRMRLKLDLHVIYNKSRDLDRALNDLIDEAEETVAQQVGIIPGHGSSALKKRVLRFLERKDIKARYHRVEKDNKNSGRLFVHFKH